MKKRMPERIIFHIDVNSAFLSWSAVDRLKKGETLDLRTVPSAVGGDVKQRRGVITARSIPAKSYGVLTGEPVVKAMEKCPGLIVIPGDYHLYNRCSRAFIEICRTYSPVLEQFSVDECFLDMTGCIENGGRAEAVNAANRLREEIFEKLSFTVNVGVAENKLLAKTASDFRKPNLVHTLWPEELEDKFYPLPVRDLLFVGKAGAERLKTLGIRTIGDLHGTPLKVLAAHFGEKTGRMYAESAAGRDDSPVRTERDDAKSYSHSTTLPYDLTTIEEVKPVLLNLSDRATYRMRRDGMKAMQITVSYRNPDFQTVSRQRMLGFSTDSSD
ncbi:MAG: DNA polymerase IV, partial [Lachnospiraceae bacterium]|nr:DNA polymerase IV [Lachnospiraceae bacterium]